MISKRIKELANLVPDVKRVIDVGCDHALLDIYLASKYDKTVFLATDISANAIKGAIKNIKESNLEKRIDIKVTDGLTNIELKKDDFIVITGMGTSTIIKIISQYLDKIDRILIQSNRDLEALRLFMFNNGFKISKEKVVYDEHYYVFIQFEKGKYIYDDLDIWLGPIIKDNNYKEYFEFLLNKYKKILSGIPDNDIRKVMVEKRIDELLKIIEKK